MSLLEKALKKIEDSKKEPEVKITPEIEKIPDSQDEKIIPREKVSVSKPKLKPKKTKICPTCNKIEKITGEKEMNRNEMVQWFRRFLIENKENLPLDWLRGQKLSFESVNEMRK